ncbi:sensor histidine kinase [Nocardiopsis sediminis]|uniref:histidine kinase n=1 Tax=Nocardiopsis sediminis TaxID=1778267 RepID=A0ABV8FLK0_9ACTN
MGDDTVQRRAFRSGEWPLRIGGWLWDRRHRIADWALAIGPFPILLFNVIALPHGPFHVLVERISTDAQGRQLEADIAWSALSAIALGAVTAVSLATLFRRSRPALLLTVAVAMAFGFGDGFPIALALFSYASWFSHRRRSLAIWTAVMVGVIGICTYFYAYDGGGGLVEAVVFATILVVAFPLTAGLLAGTRRRLGEDPPERAERLEREQHLLAEQAVNGERTRITGQRGAFPSGAWPPWIVGWLWDRRHWLADWALAIGPFPIWVSAMMLLSGPFRTLSDRALPGTLVPEDFAWIAIMLGGATTVSLATLLRRSRPAILLAVAAVLVFIFGNGFPIALALYSYASWFIHRRRSLAIWTAVMVLGVIWNDVYANVFNGGEDLIGSALFVTTLVVVLPLTAGLWVGTRRQLIDNLHERAERLEREQHLLAEQAINGERTRIAREMHDIVAHRVSLIVLHAGGLEVSTAESKTADTAGLIRTTGREALAELREILGVLRSSDDAAPTAPQPVLADLARLIGQWRTAGTSVEWVTTGTPRALPPRLERTGYRMVQEALTNAGKHAPGCPVTVRLGYGDHDLEIVVANEPLPPDMGPDTGPAAEPPPTSGYGLAGLRERIALAGGTLSAGPFPDGGWQVRAVVPIDGAAEESENEDEDERVAR